MTTCRDSLEDYFNVYSELAVNINLDIYDLKIFRLGYFSSIPIIYSCFYSHKVLFTKCKKYFEFWEKSVNESKILYMQYTRMVSIYE